MDDRFDENPFIPMATRMMMGLTTSGTFMFYQFYSATIVNRWGDVVYKAAPTIMIGEVLERTTASREHTTTYLSSMNLARHSRLILDT